MADGVSSGLRLRVISAVAMAALVFAAIAAGPFTFLALVVAAAAILGWEWSRLCDSGHFGVAGWVVAAGGAAAALVAGYAAPGVAIAVAVGAAILAYVVALASGRRDAAFWLAVGPLYAGVPAAALIWLRNEGGLSLILWLLFVVWATDIGAYFAGRAIGGPKLAPRISPKKTWAGLGGGVVSAALVGLAFAEFQPGTPGPMRLAAAGAILAVVAQIGDLFESGVKRRFGAKDSSNLIPGHGGLMDRVDGLLAAAVILGLWHYASGGGGLAWR